MAQFDKQIAKFTANTFAGFDKAYRIELFQLYNNIVMETPRISGTLKMNWFFGKSVTGQTMPEADYPVGAEQANMAKMIVDAQAVTIHDTVFIYNNMEYAEAVEKGLGKGNRVARWMVVRAIELAKGKLSVTGG